MDIENQESVRVQMDKVAKFLISKGFTPCTPLGKATLKLFYEYYFGILMNNNKVKQRLLGRTRRVFLGIIYAKKVSDEGKIHIVNFEFYGRQHIWFVNDFAEVLQQEFGFIVTPCMKSDHQKLEIFFDPFPFM